MKNKYFLKQIVPYLGLAVIILIFSIASGNALLTVKNMKVIFNQMFIILVGALGTSFVLAQGKLDFSLGSLVGVTATAGCLAAQQFGLGVALIAVLLIGAVTGAVIGLLHVIFHLNPFIVSITVLFAYRGLTWVLNGEGSLALPLSMYKYDTMTNKIIVSVIAAVIVIFMFNFTKIGKYSKAIGAGEAAAVQSGVPVGKMKVLAYMISGFFGGLCGLLSLIKAGTSFATTGTMFETDVLIALVLGGMPLSGGSNARIRAAIIGSISLAVLSNGLVLCGIDAKMQQGVKGLVLLIVVALSYERGNVAVID